jgi:hypothetical protein
MHDILPIDSPKVLQYRDRYLFVSQLGNTIHHLCLLMISPVRLCAQPAASPSSSVNNLPAIHNKLVASNNAFPFDLFPFQLCEGFIPERVSRPAAEFEHTPGGGEGNAFMFALGSRRKQFSRHTSAELHIFLPAMNSPHVYQVPILPGRHQGDDPARRALGQIPISHEHINAPPLANLAESHHITL